MRFDDVAGPRLNILLPRAVLFFCDPLSLDFGRLGMIPRYKGTMHIQSQLILTATALAFALASGLPNEVSADELKEGKVTQVIENVGSTIERIAASGCSER